MGAGVREPTYRYIQKKLIYNIASSQIMSLPDQTVGGNLNNVKIHKLNSAQTKGQQTKCPRFEVQYNEKII